MNTSLPHPSLALPDSAPARFPRASTVPDRPTGPSFPVAPSKGRTGLERLRKPVAVLCIAAWLYAALRLPVLHGGAVEWLAWSGHLLVALAVFGRIWSTLHIGGHKNGRLCRSGPYARTRNPLYFFSWLGVTGIALIFRQPWLVPLAWLGFLISFAPLIYAEESRLARLFGADFDRYRREVPRFFPFGSSNTHREASPAQAPGKLTQIEHSLADAVWFLVAAGLVNTLLVSGTWEKIATLLK